MSCADGRTSEHQSVVSARPGREPGDFPPESRQPPLRPPHTPPVAPLPATAWPALQLAHQGRAYLVCWSKNQVRQRVKNTRASQTRWEKKKHKEGTRARARPCRPPRASGKARPAPPARPQSSSVRSGSTRSQPGRRRARARPQQNRGREGALGRVSVGRSDGGEAFATVVRTTAGRDVAPEPWGRSRVDLGIAWICCCWLSAATARRGLSGLKPHSEELPQPRCLIDLAGLLSRGGVAETRAPARRAKGRRPGLPARLRCRKPCACPFLPFPRRLQTTDHLFEHNHSLRRCVGDATINHGLFR